MDTGILQVATLRDTVLIGKSTTDWNLASQKPYYTAVKCGMPNGNT